MNKIKPLVMQLAEPEYMCPECGFKFYLVLDENKVVKYFPSHCGFCDKEFTWKGKEIKI